MELAIRQFDDIIPPFADEPWAVGMKRCPRCPSQGRDEWHPLSEFGICRSRNDGLNLYCRRCIREKITLGRQASREWKKKLQERARSSRQTAEEAKPARTVLDAGEKQTRRIARTLRKLPPSDRVREAIRLGAHTLKEIVAATKLPVDEVCDCLANLLLWKRSIRTHVVDHQRMYFINGDSAHSPEPKVHKTLSPTFSSVRILMPEGRPAVRRRKTA